MTWQRLQETAQINCHILHWQRKIQREVEIARIEPILNNSLGKCLLQVGILDGGRESTLGMCLAH